MARVLWCCSSVRSIVVVGLGLGDEGKGSIVDALVRQQNIHDVLRFNGGPQAADQRGSDDHPGAMLAAQLAA